MKRLVNNDLYNRYSAEIHKLRDKGYAEEVPEYELFSNDRIWYLQHHAVLSDKKPDKLGVVFLIVTVSLEVNH